MHQRLPAALGIRGFDAFIDSYLHPPTVIRGFRFAMMHQRPVVFASQPLAGAELFVAGDASQPADAAASVVPSVVITCR